MRPVSNFWLTELRKQATKVTVIVFSKDMELIKKGMGIGKNYENGIEIIEV